MKESLFHEIENSCRVGAIGGRFGVPLLMEESIRWDLTPITWDPEVLEYVDRRFDYSIKKRPLRSKETAHPEDRAIY